MSRTVATVAAVLAGGVALSTLLFTFVMINDINSFYEDSMRELTEWKDVSNAAWRGMMPSGLDMLRVPRAAVHRKRQSQCNCGAQPNNCPAGPPGPPGAPGEVG